MVMWTCSAVDGGVARPFINLTDADFAECGSTTGGPTCESLLPTTQAPITGSTDRPKPVVFRVSQTWAADQDPATTLNVWWTISRDVEVASLALTCQSEGSPTADRYEVSTTSRNGSYVIGGLSAATAYTICLDVTTVAQGTMTECTPGLTKHAAVSPSSSANFGLILGVAIGCTVAVAIIVVVIVCCCVTASKRHRQSNVASQAPGDSMAPKHSIQTKRFRKQKTSMTDADRASYGRAGATAGGAATGAAITQADIDRALVNTVERLDPQSKDILASLLRSASAASLDRLGSGSGVGPSNYLYTRSNAFENGTSDEPWTPGVGADRHIYEELPDDTYDKIPTDDEV
jgi:hypothetical protein